MTLDDLSARPIPSDATSLAYRIVGLARITGNSTTSEFNPPVSEQDIYASMECIIQMAEQCAVEIEKLEERIKVAEAGNGIIGARISSVS